MHWNFSRGSKAIQYQFLKTFDSRKPPVATRIEKDEQSFARMLWTNLFRIVDQRRRGMLCPVRWYARGGWLLVMAAAIPLTEIEKDRLKASNGFPDWDYMPGEEGQPFEHKASDWGWFVLSA
jgi:hypothetical protein